MRILLVGILLGAGHALQILVSDLIGKAVRGALAHLATRLPVVQDVLNLVQCQTKLAQRLHLLWRYILDLAS